jgi:hypothetical protein
MSKYGFSLIFLSLLIISFLKTPYVLANPYYYINAKPQAIVKEKTVFQIKIDTTGDTVDELGGVFEYSSLFWQFIEIDTNNSICKIWQKSNVVDTDFINKITPFVVNNKVYFQCSLNKKSYTGSDGLIATIMLLPLFEGNTELFLKKPFFSIITTPIRPGAMDKFLVNIVPKALVTPKANINSKQNIQKKSIDVVKILLLLLIFVLYIMVIFHQKIWHYWQKNKHKYPFIAKFLSRSHNLNNK